MTNIFFPLFHPNRNSPPMSPQFGQPEREAAESLIALALQEDLADEGDLTCQALIDVDARGVVDLVARAPGIFAGWPIAELVFAELDPAVHCERLIEDGTELKPGDVVGRFRGSLQSLLIGERTTLNFLTHLSGIASLTRQFVDAVRGTRAVILDTRKTHPGYRVLEKYAVRAGGGRNHRMGLFDGILIKDNHIAACAESQAKMSIGEVIEQVRNFLGTERTLPIEIEVDTLEQLEDALVAGADIVLLDNMNPDLLREAVAMRDRLNPETQLESSGGVTLETVRAIAETGVERISIGALTHSARALDLAFDWETA
ncbi:MAG: carboxylating nicotinate-nucleotide diphosphorylase [Planctomycetaceae bacterium]